MGEVEGLFLGREDCVYDGFAVGEGVRVGVGDEVGAKEGSMVGVGEGEGVEGGAAVGVAVGVGDGVRIAVGVDDGVGVREGVGVGDGDGIGAGDGVGVGVGVTEIHDIASFGILVRLPSLELNKILGASAPFGYLKSRVTAGDPLSIAPTTASVTFHSYHVSLLATYSKSRSYHPIIGG